MASFSNTSLNRLDTCHTDLQVLAREVIKVHDCTVVTGYRNKEDQQQMYDDKLSQVLFPDSNHNEIPSNALDLAPYVPSMGGLTYDKEYSLYFSGIVLGTADRLYACGLMAHKLRWGGNWSTNRNKTFKNVNFYDGLHYELMM